MPETLDPRVERTLSEFSVGDEFGRLRVLSTDPEFITSGKKRVRKRLALKCQCVCGQTALVRVFSLQSGNTTSCGCLHKERASAANTTHGATAGGARPRLYRIWKAMRERCTNPNADNYRWYGGKGVEVDPAWDDFGVFRDWAHDHGYADGLEIDRIDAQGPYSPENCRWVTKQRNIQNKDIPLLPADLDQRLRDEAEKRGVSWLSLLSASVSHWLTEHEGR